MMVFHEALDIVILPCFPSSSWTGMKSGKSTKRYYIKLLLTFHVSRHTTKMMKFHEVLDIVILPCFPSSSWTEMKSGKSIIRIYTYYWLPTFHGKVWKWPKLRKCFSCLLFRVSENGFAKIKKKWIWYIYTFRGIRPLPLWKLCPATSKNTNFI